MQFFRHDLRRWGYIKIVNCFFKSPENFQLQLCDFKDVKSPLSPYSIPAYCKGGVEHRGIDKLLLHIEPLFDSVDVDSSCKRRFDYLWKNILESVQQAFNFSDDTVEQLSCMLICSSFADETFNAPSWIEEDWVLDFVNALFTWYLLTKSEHNLDRNGFSALNLIDKMVRDSDADFVSSIISCVLV